MENLVVSIIGQLNLKNMKLTPIKYQEGWLYVDKEATIQQGDLYLEHTQIKPDRFELYKCNHFISIENSFKVVAQRNLSLPNIPYIEEVEEDVNIGKLAELHTLKMLDEYKSSNSNSFIEGYKAAQYKGGYSESDMEKAIQFGIDITAKHTTPTYGTNFDKVEDDKNTYIQSLNQPKENIEIITKCSMCSMIDGHKLSCITESLRNQTPVTYRKDGKTFLKVKQ
jgi:hypothetical protein